MSAPSFGIFSALQDSLAVGTLRVHRVFKSKVSTFRVVSALQDFLAVGTLRVHRVFKSKFHFPTGSGMPLDSIRDASAVVEMVCSCRANPVRRHWSVGASASSFFVQGSPRSQTAVCRGICFSTFWFLIPLQLQEWSTSQPFCYFLLLHSRRKP